MTLGLLTTTDSAVGGADRITSGAGDDAVLGGIGGDTIDAGDGANVVLGDNGLVDWTAAERGGTLPGDDADASDIDRIRSLDPALGGDDTITTGPAATSSSAARARHDRLGRRRRPDPRRRGHDRRRPVGAARPRHLDRDRPGPAPT